MGGNHPCGLACSACDAVALIQAQTNPAHTIIAVITHESLVHTSEKEAIAPIWGFELKVRLFEGMSLTFFVQPVGPHSLQN
jgi:hypothetical protein